MQASMKKSIIIQIFRILYNYSSAEHPVTQSVIVEYLNDLDIECTRKTVGRNIVYLMRSGVPIKRKEAKKGGYFYDHENDGFLKRVKFNEKGEVCK